MHDKILPTSLPSALALAYIGDARHSLYVRKMLVSRGISRPAELNRLALEYVTCEAQAAAFEKISEMLSEDEAEIFKYAFNSTHLNKPKRSSGKDYRVATGFEAVIGMLDYIGDEERLSELLSIATTDIGGQLDDTEN